MWTSTDTGLVDIGELANGTYLLAETASADGYQLPLGAWKLTVDKAAEQPVAIVAQGTVPAFYTGDGGGLFVPNFLKSTMPATGGRGITALVFCGTLLVGAAIIISFLPSKTKRRPSAEHAPAKADK